MSARKVPFQFSLLELPTELIAHVVEQVNTPEDLQCLARTCRRLQLLAEPVLYRWILTREWHSAEKVLAAIRARRDRGAAVHVLDLPCDVSLLQDFAVICEIMIATRNLKELMIESPQCNGGDFEEEEEWEEMTNLLFEPFELAVDATLDATLPFRPLQKLQSRRSSLNIGDALLQPAVCNADADSPLCPVTLHLNGPSSPYWEIDRRSVNILLHPTLKHLKMSCVNITGSLDKLLQGHSSSPLRHLELEECNVTANGLRVLLSVPEALEQLYLGENCHNARHFLDHDFDDESNQLFSADIVATMAALSQQKATLTTLTYVTSDIFGHHLQHFRIFKPNFTKVDGGFADFHALQKVSLIGECPDFERALMTSRSPPNLHTLEHVSMLPISGDYWKPARDEPALAHMPFFRAPACSVPSTLKTLAVSYDQYRPSRGHWNDKIHRIIEKAAPAALKVGAGVDITVTARVEHRYFPPFLWGEPVPEEVVLYGGVNVGFKNYSPRPHTVVETELDDNDLPMAATG